MVNGQHFSGTGYQLDGTENRDPILGIIVINPTLESIGETKITSQNYDAEFGQATAGVVSVQTKSGSQPAARQRVRVLPSGRVAPGAQPVHAVPARSADRQVPARDRASISSAGRSADRSSRNKWFFFGDYQGTRNTIGGSRLLSRCRPRRRAAATSAPTASTSTIPRPAFRRRGSSSPATRFRPAGCRRRRSRCCRADADAECRGPRERHHATTSSPRDRRRSTATRSNVRDRRPDARRPEHVRPLQPRRLPPRRAARRSAAKAAATSWSRSAACPTSRNQSLAYGVDWAFSTVAARRLPLRLVPLQRQRAAVRLRHDAGAGRGHSRPQPRQHVRVGPAGLLHRRRFGQPPHRLRLRPRRCVNRCNCPLDQDEKQLQIVGNLTKLWGTHSFKFGIDVRRAYNLRVPSDRHRSGELTFTRRSHARPERRRPRRSRRFMLGDVTHFGRYVSPTVDARERQWRHFYYAQDTWRPTAKLTLNYGLRLDVINPQTLNEAGNGGFLDLDTGQIKVAGVGGIGLNGDVENTPQLGAARRRDLSGRPEDGHPRRLRPQLRHRRLRLALRPQRDAEPAGALDPAAQRARQLRAGVHPRDRPAAAGVPGRAHERRVPAARRRLRPGAARKAAAAARGRLQRHRAARADADDVARGRVRRQPRRQRVRRRRPGHQHQSGDDRSASPGCPGTAAAARTSTQFGWTQGIDFFCNCATNSYDALQTKLTKRFADGYSLQVNYTLQKAEQDGGEYFQTPLAPAAGLFDTALNRGPADWDRTHNLVVSLVAELPIGRGRPYLSDISPVMNLLVGGWQFNTNTFIQSGLPFNVNYRDAGADRDTGPNRPDLIGDPDGPQTREQWFNAAPIGASGSAFGRPARRHVRQPAAQRAARARLLAGGRLALQALRLRRHPNDRSAHRGGQPLQPRQPRQPRFRDRRARQPERERGADQFDGLRRQRSAAQLPVRAESAILSASIGV